jgi:hypothetical protein
MTEITELVDNNLKRFKVKNLGFRKLINIFNDIKENMNIMKWML